MATRQEIMQRAADACRDIAARYDAERAEIISQREAALAGFPRAAAALRASETARASARAAYDAAVKALQEKAVAHEQTAIDTQVAAEAQALEDWHVATRKADGLLARDLNEAGATYEAAYEAAAAATGPGRDARMIDARRKRDAAIETAQQEHQQKVDAAWDAYNAATAKAREDAIADTDEARRTEAEKAGELASSRDAAVQKAEQTLRAALTAEPVAAAVFEAFSTRLRDAEEQCAADKDAVLTRMKVALAGDAAV